MARSFEETAAPQHAGPCDCVLLSATVTLDDRLCTGGSFGPISLHSLLVSYVSDPDAAQRLRLVAASIRRGRQTVTTHSRWSWVGQGDPDAPPQQAPEIALVLAIPSVRRDLLDLYPLSLGSSKVSSLIVVTDDPDQFAGLQFINGFVKAPADDLLGTAITVYQMLVAMMAPDTYACTDLEDFLAVFAMGSYAQVCQPVWSPESGLVFASPADQSLVENARGLLVHLDLEKFGRLVATGAVFREVRCRAPQDCSIVLIGPIRMSVPGGARAGFQQVPLLCVEGP